MIFGYCRVSMNTQSLEKQVEQLKEAECEKIFQEKITGTKIERPELIKMLDQLREGDTILICDLTRLGRSTKDLFKLVELIESKGANIKSLKESWMDTTTAQGKLMFTIFSGISQFERDMISVRTKESLANCRKRGIVGGRPKVDTRKIDTAIKMYESKLHSISEITKATGVSKTSLYRYLKKSS